LHYSLNTAWIGWIRDGAVVGRFVVAIGGEGVGDAGKIWLDQAVIDGIIEAL